MAKSQQSNFNLPTLSENRLYYGKSASSQSCTSLTAISPRHGKASTPGGTNTGEKNKTKSSNEREGKTVDNNTFVEMKNGAMKIEDEETGSMFVETHSVTTVRRGSYDSMMEVMNRKKNNITPLIARSTDLALTPQYHSLNFGFEDFFYENMLGSGVSACCYKAIERRTHLNVAVKVFSKISLIQRNQEFCVIKEIELQAHLKHPNVVPILTWFHDEERIAIVMAYCSQGDLFKHLDKSRRIIDEKSISRMVFDVLWALRYCHAHCITHLDLKPENILVDNGRLLLGDFGMSEHLNSQHGNLQKNRGTHDYWCPEQTVKGGEFGSFNHKADIWCVGVLAYEMLIGRPPFGSVLDNKTKEEIQHCIKNDPWHKRLIHHFKDRKTSEVFYDFLNRCLQKKSENRPTAEQLFEHEFVKKHNQDKLKAPNFLSQHYVPGVGFNDPLFDKKRGRS